MRCGPEKAGVRRSSACLWRDNIMSLAVVAKVCNHFRSQDIVELDNFRCGVTRVNFHLDWSDCPVRIHCPFEPAEQLALFDRGLKTNSLNTVIPNFQNIPIIELPIKNFLPGTAFFGNVRAIWQNQSRFHCGARFPFAFWPEYLRPIWSKMSTWLTGMWWRIWTFLGAGDWGIFKPVIESATLFTWFALTSALSTFVESGNTSWSSTMSGLCDKNSIFSGPIAKLGWTWNSNQQNNEALAFFKSEF